MTEKIRCALYSIMGIALGIVLLLPGGHVQASEKRRFTTAVMYHSARTGKHGQPVLGTGTINGMTKTKQRQCIPESNLPGGITGGRTLLQIQPERGSTHRGMAGCFARCTMYS